MRKLLQYLFARPLTWFANKFSASPDRKAVFKSLSDLYNCCNKPKSRRVKTININSSTDNFIIFSDHHKGNKDAGDDFKNCEPNYIAALEHYHEQCFTYINLGDSEELWKYKPSQVLPKITAALAAEAAFQPGNKYYRTFGNHDIIWKNKLDVQLLLKPYFTMPLPVPEGIILHITINDKPLSIFLTHGHQGDKLSDNNRLSTWFVAHLWTPVQRYLRLNVNTPSKDDKLLNHHNKMMYEWSSKQKNVLLITGHTHQPVFASGKYSSHPANDIPGETTTKVRPTYFNSGCCCFSDGDITGIEISDGKIALIKWYREGDTSKRKMLEEIRLEDLITDLL
jgi:predicted phosphodiesterase